MAHPNGMVLEIEVARWCQSLATACASTGAFQSGMSKSMGDKAVRLMPSAAALSAQTKTLDSEDSS